MLQSLKNCLRKNISFIVGLFIGAASVACATIEAPEWAGRLWQGNSKRKVIVHTDINSGHKDYIYTGSPEFDKYVCMSIPEFSDIVRIINDCREW